ncbi:DUF1611 domain-containing protein [Leucobacter sp. NPDC058333]|uniref:DUF1611 domain-containing protein n=1 Tax=Leucobacter sp. NPDC058333 TaxID=3346450 RepID=UPI003664B50C
MNMHPAPNTSNFAHLSEFAITSPQLPGVRLPVGNTALIYCEGLFGEQDGKTANGLVRSSERYQIIGVIDSTCAGQDAGTLLDGEPNGIPIYATLADAISHSAVTPDYVICGLAPASGSLAADQRGALLEGLSLGMHLVNGLHEFLNDDAEFLAASRLANVTITDVRRPKPKKDLKMFTGQIFDVSCPRIAILGTDGAVGKRTTATLLVRALNQRGIRAVLVGTGQTTLIQGTKYGVALDAITPQFCSGEVEAQVVAAFNGEQPDVIVVEGQGALSHPAYLSSTAILRGSRPQAVIVQHAPKRVMLGDYPRLKTPTVRSEIALIEAFADTQVIGVAINHEGMAQGELDAVIDAYTRDLGLPATDPLTRPIDELAQIVVRAFPALVTSTAPAL